jgi:hypothetical protein
MSEHQSSEQSVQVAHIERSSYLPTDWPHCTEHEEGTRLETPDQSSPSATESLLRQQSLLGRSKSHPRVPRKLPEAPSSANAGRPARRCFQKCLLADLIPRTSKSVKHAGALRILPSSTGTPLEHEDSLRTNTQ